MGNSASKSVGYRELRSSIPGSLIHEEDFKLFYSLCKVESQRTMSTVLQPNANQLFYVVITGEVVVQLSCPTVKSVNATTFTAGETIHFFNAPLRGNSGLPAFEYSDFGECLRNGDIKLALTFKSEPKETARVIGIDRRGMDEFLLKARSNVYALTNFLNIDMVNLFLGSPCFRTMTLEQACMFGPLLKVRLAHTGREVGAHIPPSAMKPVDSVHPRHGAGTPVSAGSTAAQQGQGHVVMVLQGELLSINKKGNITQIVKDLLSKEASAAKHSSGTVISLRERAASAMAGFSGSLSPQLSTIADLEKDRDSEDVDSGRKLSNLLIGPGIVVGSDQLCVRNPAVRMRAYLVSAPSVIGYAPFTSMDALFRVDPRFQRVYWRNMYMITINWVKFSVPFLMDMDDWSLALLSCKLNMIGVNAGEVIKQQGASSDYAFILLGGAAKITEGNKPHDHQDIKTGELFGVMALTSNQPYFHTVVATEPCTVLRLSKRVLDQIYYNNKAKLCEIRIRLMGANVDLLHAIDHPKGGDLFLQYLTRERAAENLTFYRAVDRFDAMCKEVVKQHSLAKKMVERHFEAQRNAAALKDHLAAYSSADRGTSEAPDDTGSLLRGDFERTHHGELSAYSTATSVMTAAFYPPRLPTIVSVSNLPAGTNSANNSTKEEDNQKHYSVKTKPSASARNRAVPTVRQSSFSSRVAIALAEDPDQEGDGDGDLASSVVSRGDLGGANANVASADTTDGRPSPVGESAPDAAQTTETGEGAAVAVTPRKKRHHRSSFLKTKSQDTSARPHDFADVTGRATSHGGSYAGSQAGSSFRSAGPAGDAQKDEHGPSQAERSRARVNRHINQLLISILELKQVARNIMETFVHNGAENQLNLPGAMRVRCELQYNTWYADQGPQSPIPAMVALGAPSSDTVESATIGSFSSATPKVAGMRQSSSMSEGVSVAFRSDNASGAQAPATQPRAQQGETLALSATTADNADTVIALGDSRLSPNYHSFAARGTALSGMPTFFPASASADAPADALPVSAAQEAHNSSGVVTTAAPVEVPLIPLESIDLSFVELFREAKQEILKLLRDDKFPRWKATKDFQSFITSVRPYADKDSDRHANTLDRKSDVSFDRSLASFN